MPKKDNPFCKILFRKNSLINFMIIDDYCKSMDLDHSSPYVESLIEASVYLSFFIAAESHMDCISLSKIIHHEYYKNLVMTYPNPEFFKDSFFSTENIDQLRNDSYLTLTDGYNDGYKVKFIEGVPNGFRFGNNTYQCPIEILYKHFSCLNYLNCICQIDFLRSNYFKTGLKRTKCLAYGDSYCDFRRYEINNI